MVISGLVFELCLVSGLHLTCILVLVVDYYPINCIYNFILTTHTLGVIPHVLLTGERQLCWFLLLFEPQQRTEPKNKNMRQKKMFHFTYVFLGGWDSKDGGLCLLRVLVAVCVKFYVQFICALFCAFLGMGFIYSLFRACLMVYVVFIWCFCMFYLEL